MPHHLVPRLGSACLNEGIAPWAAARGHPWPSAANPASMPGCPLRNTFVQPAWLTGRRDQRPLRGGLVADLVLDGTVFLLWGLLAKAVCQFAVMLDVLASSRASSLPQVILGVHESCVHRRPIVGASLLAIAVVQSHGCWVCWPLREQAPTGFAVHMDFVSAKDPMWERACSR